MGLTQIKILGFFFNFMAKPIRTVYCFHLFIIFYYFNRLLILLCFIFYRHITCIKDILRACYRLLINLSTWWHKLNSNLIFIFTNIFKFTIIFKLDFTNWVNIAKQAIFQMVLEVIIGIRIAFTEDRFFVNDGVWKVLYVRLLPKT